MGFRMVFGIFVSYRRDDSKHAAGRLTEHLRRYYDDSQLFVDVISIEPGLNFKKVIKEKVNACDVLLAVIGANWLSILDSNGHRRIDNSKDFIRLELEAALERGVRIIPVLVDGANIPIEGELPVSLRPITELNSLVLTHERFGTDVELLVKTLFKLVVPAKNIKNPNITISDSPQINKWRAYLISKVFLKYTILLEKGYEKHELYLDYRNLRLKDSLFIDGKEKVKFIILGFSKKLEFKIEPHPNVFSILITLNFFQTSVKTLELFVDSEKIASF